MYKILNEIADKYDLSDDVSANYIVKILQKDFMLVSQDMDGLREK